MLFGLPLIVTDGFYNITETKYVFFILLSVFLLVPCGIFISNNFKEVKIHGGIPSDKKDMTTIDWAVFAFGACVFLSAFFSAYPADAWLGISARYQGALTIAVYVLVYFLISRNYAKEQNYLFFAVAAFCIVSTLGVLNCFDIDFFGFYHKLSSGYKTSFISTIGNINFYSSYFCLLFPLVICGYSLTKKKISRVVYSFALVAGSFGMMVTASESFCLGFAVSLLIIPLFFFGDRKKTVYYLQSIVIIIVSSQLYNFIYSKTQTNVEISKSLRFFLKPAVSLGAFLLCVAFYLFLNLMPDKMKYIKKIYIGFLVLLVITAGILFIVSNTVGLGELDEYFKITSEWGTYRGKIWRFCFDKFKNYNLKEILFGIGPEALQNLSVRGEIFTDQTLDQAHNEYIQYVMTTGIFGFLSYLAILAAVTVTVIKKLKHSTLAVGIYASLVAYWIQGAVNISQPFTTPIMFIYISCIGGMWLQEKRENQTKSKKETLVI